MLNRGKNLLKSTLNGWISLIKILLQNLGTILKSLKTRVFLLNTTKTLVLIWNFPFENFPMSMIRYKWWAIYYGRCRFSYILYALLLVLDAAFTKSLMREWNLKEIRILRCQTKSMYRDCKFYKLKIFIPTSLQSICED